MGRQREKLIHKARTNPSSLTHDEAVRLAGHGGLTLRKKGGKGSHGLYQRDDPRVTVILTNNGGDCPEYQVRQMLEKLDRFDLLD